MTHFTNRIQELVTERAQLIARVNQIEGAIIELQKINQEEHEEHTEVKDTEIVN